MQLSIADIRRLIKEIIDVVPASNPSPDCPECQGTGLYRGFNSIEPCQLCQNRTVDQDTSKTTLSNFPTTARGKSPWRVNTTVNVLGRINKRSKRTKDWIDVVELASQYASFETLVTEFSVIDSDEREVYYYTK